jgi:hypothetical protein
MYRILDLALPSHTSLALLSVSWLERKLERVLIHLIPSHRYVSTSHWASAFNRRTIPKAEKETGNGDSIPEGTAESQGDIEHGFDVSLITGCCLGHISTVTLVFTTPGVITGHWTRSPMKQ